MLTGSMKERPSRRRTQKKQETPVRIVGATAAASVLTLTFDQPVVLKGVPAYSTDVAGATPVSAVASSPTVVAITFSAAIAAATEVTIPPTDPGIRGSVGGYVADTTFPV